jgi:hypothetical protein
VESPEKHAQAHAHARGPSRPARIGLLGLVGLAWGTGCLLATHVHLEDPIVALRSPHPGDSAPWFALLVLAVAGGYWLAVALSGLRRRRPLERRQRGNVDASGAVARATGREGPHPAAQNWPVR